VADCLALDDPEPHFDEVEPRCRGWGEVGVDAWVGGQPRVDLGGLVGGVVVADQVQFLVGVGAGHLLEERQVFGAAVSGACRRW